jgi:hypothetical protein
MSQPTFIGYVQTANDAAILIAACKSQILQPTTQRLTEFEKQSIKPGYCFVYLEQNSKIKRWTDGLKWGPSKIDKDFMLYIIKDVSPNKNTPEFKKTITLKYSRFFSTLK